MKTQASLWETYSADTDFPSLTDDITVDVVIIGGGICGITAAQLLSEKGLKTAVLESYRVGKSSTNSSTGNLYSMIDLPLSYVQKKHGIDILSRVVDSRTQAVNLIERNINRFNIDCDFERVPWYFYTTILEEMDKIEAEFNIGEKINLNFNYTTLKGIPFTEQKAITLENQAQFNPLRYVQGLAKSISNECSIFENTKVNYVQLDDQVHILHTPFAKISARYVIHATHTPKGFFIHHAMLGPYREYGVACKIRGNQHPHGIFWGYFEKDQIISTRFYQRGDENFLIVVGKPHKVGQGDSNAHMMELEKFAHKYFEVSEITHRWGGQYYRPADHLPYIGRSAADANSFIATGFSTDGLVYGNLAAQILTDVIRGEKNIYADIYNSLRFTPLASSAKFFKENANVANQYLKDYIIKRDHGDFAGIAPGEGKVLTHDGQKIAVYKDEERKLEVCTAICTHLGCVVHWNNAEQSWDCPCHGSRFNTAGEVIEGPALIALTRIEVEKEKDEVIFHKIDRDSQFSLVDPIL